MRNSNGIKLNVKIVKPHTALEPIRFRRYTINLYDDLNSIDLTIGPYFEMLTLDTVNTNVIYSQWYWFVGDTYHLTLFAFVGDDSYEVSKCRYEQFLEKLPLAVLTIINGDRKFLDNRPNLINTPILVRFISTYPEFNKTIPFFRIRDFINTPK